MPDFLDARVTHLEMYERPQNVVPAPLNMRLAIMRAYQMPVHYYRYLYQQIGKAHHWNVRRKMSDPALKQLIQSDDTVIQILYNDGCPAGFAETNLKGMPKTAEIVYFGLVPDYQGRGLSYFFFNEVLLSAWENNPEKVIIQTNTLDSPRALQLYQKCGFIPVSYNDVKIERWR
ncbi:GNAT family N-acetyltransferase [uncultured Bartonella sp.]|uniref:GNAT family N-acetyltransferase n=1 Tax=uncultured Bartonella sp. TaxID=104108 RepID=UPI0026347C62|nr:GNAT family N-acetyltransferase [uncultured Bartonella sp.]